jgi:hypothetical protein
MTPPTPMRFSGGLHPSPHGPPTFTMMHSTEARRWQLIVNPTRSSRYPDRSEGRTGLPLIAFRLVSVCNQPRSSVGIGCTIGCGRWPIGQDLEPGVRFPVGFSLLRFLTLCFLSQARPLGGLPRASPVPFRASYFTSGVHPPDATAQRLIACLYRRWRFPLIASLCFVAHNTLRATCLVPAHRHGLRSLIMPAWRDTHCTKGCLLKAQLALHTGDSAANGDDGVIEVGEEC